MRSKPSATRIDFSEQVVDDVALVDSRLATVLSTLYEMQEYTAYPPQDLKDCIRHVEVAIEGLWRMHETCELAIERLDRCNRDQKDSVLRR